MKSQSLFRYVSPSFWLLAIALWSCSNKTDTTTAQEFIDLYVKAYKSENVEAILAMQASLETLKKTPITPKLKEQLENYSIEKERERIQKDLERKGLGYIMGTNTRYESEKDHDDHIHVRVKVDIAYSEIVLVRENGLLKIHPWPSSYIN
ncbi:MAG: hypothetical protein V1799_11865 [bacterium]